MMLTGRATRRIAVRGLIVVVVAPVIACLLLAVFPVPVTPLILIRAAEGAGRERQWAPLDRISTHLAASVIAGEDSQFCRHVGFDAEALEKAWRGYSASGRTRPLRGGSTITQQTVKNVFLWPERSWLRKGLEAWLTIYAEVFWSKRRTLEIYLNVVEWGDGLYGAEAAARKYFGKSAAALTAAEAARMAAVLPSPRKWSVTAPGPYVSRRAATIRARAERLGPLLDCLN